MRISDIRNTQQFQDLCQQLFAAEYEDLEVPDDSSGDEGSDGYVPSLRRLFAIYCPEKYPPPNEYYQRKIRGDLSKAVKLRNERGYEIDEWIFVTPAPLPMEVHRYLRDRVKEAGFARGINWSEKHLMPLLLRHRELQPLYPELFAPDLQTDIRSGFATLSVEIRAGFDDLMADKSSLDEARQKFESRVAEDYERRFRSTKELFERGLYEQAKAASAAILNDLQRDADARTPSLLARACTNIAVCAWHLEEIEDVIKWFEEAHRHTPEDPKAMANRATALMYRDQSDEALAAVEQILAANPEDDNAITVKANILLKERRYDEVTAFLESKGRLKLRSFFHSVHLNYLNRYDEAASVLRGLLQDEPENVTYLEHAASNILIEQQRRMQREHRLSWKTTEAMRRAFTEAEEYLSTIIKLLEGKEAQHKLVGAYINRSAARLMLGESQTARDDCEEALRFDPDNANAYLNKSKAEIELGEYSSAAESLERYSELTGEIGDKARDLVFCYYATGQLDKAVTVINEELSRDWTEDNLSLVSLAVHVFDLRQEPDAATELVRRAEESFPDHPLTFTIRARHEQNIGGANVETLLRRAVEAASPEQKELATLDLADYLYGAGRYSEALPLFAQVISEHEFAPVNYRYLVCLYNSGKFSETIEFAAKMRGGEKTHHLISPIEALACKALGRLRQAADILLALYQLEAGRTDYLVEYGICLFRLDEADKALRAFDQARNRVSKTKDLLALAHGYNFLGQPVAAVKLTYQALQQSPHDPHVHRAYINSVLNMKDDDGLKLGAEGEMYVKAFQEVIAQFNTRFPEEQGMKLLDVKENFTELFDVLDQSAARTTTIIEHYRNGALPVSVVAELKGRSLYEIWLGLQALADTGFRIKLGTAEEAERERRAVANGDEVVVDSLALLTLERTRQLNLLHKMSKRVIVHQDVFDDIQSALRDERRSIERGGRLTIGKIGEQYFKEEIAPELIQKEVDALERIKAFIKNECQIAGFDKELSEEDAQIIEAVGLPTGSSALLAEQRGLPLLSDDGLLCRQLNHERNIECFSTYALFAHAAEKGTLPRSRFYDLTLLLLRMNYRFVPTDASCLLYAARNDGYRGGGDFERALTMLGNRETNTQSLGGVLAEFLARLWVISLPLMLKEFVLKRVLKAATREHAPEAILNFILDHLSTLRQGAPLYSSHLAAQIIRWANDAHPNIKLVNESKDIQE